MDSTGQTPTDERPGLDIPAVLRRCWERPFHTRADFARAHADSVAAAASLGYLTTQTGPASFDRLWRLTPSGLAHLWLLEGLEQ